MKNVILNLNIVLLIVSCTGTATKSTRTGYNGATAQNAEKLKTESSVSKIEKNDLETSKENVDVGEKSESVEIINKELGISIHAPVGLVTQAISPNIKINSLRKSFDSTYLVKQFYSEQVRRSPSKILMIVIKLILSFLQIIMM